jgi:hypothetical protein
MPGPPPHITEEMSRLKAVSEELLRRASRRYPLTGPAKVMEGILDKLPVEKFPKAFEQRLAVARQRLVALETTRAPREDVTLLLKACQECHHEHSTRGTTIVDSLKLPPETAESKPAQPPRPKESAPTPAGAR